MPPHAKVNKTKFYSNCALLNKIVKFLKKLSLSTASISTGSNSRQGQPKYERNYMAIVTFKIIIFFLSAVKSYIVVLGQQVCNNSLFE